MISLKLTQVFRFISCFNLFSNQISAPTLNQRMQHQGDRFLLVDVRSQAEYEQEHLPEAILIPLSAIEQGRRIEEIQLASRGRQLVVYCTVGKRSQKALHLLKSAGISGLNLRGGIRAWHRFTQASHAQTESGISP